MQMVFDTSAIEQTHGFVLFLQCNDFNQGHSMLFNQSEADSLT